MEKILLILESDVTQNLLSEALADYDVRICNADQAATTLAQFQPDALVLDLFLPGTDGFTLMTDCSAQLPSVVLLLTVLVSDYICEKASNLGVGFLIQKPCSIECIVKHLVDMLLAKQFPGLTDHGSIVDHVLSQFSIHAKPRVLRALNQAVLIRAQNPDYSLTKDIYPQICQDYGSSTDAVDQAIRRALRNAWKFPSGRTPFWDQLFSGYTECPSNDDFISTVAGHLHKKYPSHFRKGS